MQLSEIKKLIIEFCEYILFFSVPNICFINCSSINLRQIYFYVDRGRKFIDESLQKGMILMKKAHFQKKMGLKRVKELGVFTNQLRDFFLNSRCDVEICFERQ